MRLVGSPVLDEAAPSGLYLWLEDGWFQLAALGVPMTETASQVLEEAATLRATGRAADRPPLGPLLRVRVVGTGRVDSGELADFRRERHDPKGFVARVEGSRPARIGRFRSEGDFRLEFPNAGDRASSRQGSRVEALVASQPEGASTPGLFVGPLAERVLGSFVDVGRY